MVEPGVRTAFAVRIRAAQAPHSETISDAALHHDPGCVEVDLPNAERMPEVVILQDSILRGVGRGNCWIIGLRATWSEPAGDHWSEVALGAAEIQTDILVSIAEVLGIEFGDTRHRPGADL